MNEEKEKKQLPVKLTETEKLDYAKKLAGSVQALDALEDEKKTATDYFKGKISAVEGDLHRLSRAIVSGEEEREVSCVWVPDWDANIKALVREDTGEDEKGLASWFDHLKDVGQSIAIYKSIRGYALWVIGGEAKLNKRNSEELGGTLVREAGDFEKRRAA